MIASLELKNFTAFSHLDIDFSPKINVIIGENNTGKTHLLKAAYGIYVIGPLLGNEPDYPVEELESDLTTRFLRLFLPLDSRLGRMHHHGVGDDAFLDVKFAQGQKITATFSKRSKLLKIRWKGSYESYEYAAVFIPTKEVLSFTKGFNSLYEKYGLSFDQTYQDICLLLELPELRPEALHEKSKWAMEEIEKICGGRFIFSGGGKVTFKTKKAEYSANSIAEGFRKVGMLSRLLETGAIKPGIGGPLFWDEPEANLNPKMMKLLVQILLELSRNGQQIILATHDYVLLKWFDLLTEKGKDDHVRYHSLYQDVAAGEIKIASTDNYIEVAPNSIDEAFGYLIDKEIENDMGNLGK